MKTGSRLQSSLGRVRGLGSAKSGVHHWWVQRLTAIALLPLSTWLVSAMIMLIGQPYDVFKLWISTPWSAVLLLATVFLIYYHTYLGLQVVLEDYLTGPRYWIVSLVIKGTIMLCGALSLFSILKIALT